MSISLVGLTLHVADVERSLNFYKRLPDSSLLRVGSGRLGLLQDSESGHRWTGDSEFPTLIPTLMLQVQSQATAVHKADNSKCPK